MFDNNNSENSRIFIIPHPNLPKFQERFAKVLKRAEKIVSRYNLNIALPSFSLLKVEARSVQVIVGEEEDQFGRMITLTEDRLIIYNHIRIDSGHVEVGGYEFVATIEHLEEGNMIHSHSKTAVPSTYRECKPWCDHCKTMRRRTDTFLVRHTESGQYKQIGRNCLRDFIGFDAENYAALAEIYYELGEIGDASEGGEGYGFGGGGDRFDYLDGYLSFVAETISRNGWRSRTTAKEYGGSSTADIALRHMHPSKEDIRENLLEWRKPSEKSVQTAKDAIAWCEAISDADVEGSDYLYNIRLIAKRGIVGGKHYGYAASIVSGYLKHLGELIKKQRQAEKPSEYVGTVGERQVFTLLVEKVIKLESMFTARTSYLHLMSDKDSNRFTWKSSGECFDQGEEIVLKGTVKEHSEYKGVKQTKLTRCEKIEMKDFIYSFEGTTLEGKAANEKEFRKDLLKKLNLARMPKGAIIAEKVGQ